MQKTFALCLAEGVAALVTALTLILLFGKNLIAIFNNDPEVVSFGYTRLMFVMISHSFSFFYEVMSGYLRGFGISLVPAILTTAGVCGVRIAWIRFVFPHSETFSTIMTAFPVSLSVTAVMIFVALLCYHPSKRYRKDGESSER